MTSDFVHSIDSNVERDKTDVWTQLEVADTTGDVLVMRVVQVPVDDLFGQRERSVEPASEKAGTAEQ